jgi:hypothetical protein
MIYIEYHILDPKTYMPKASYMKTFESGHEFNKFYQLVKTDTYAILDIFKYDPQVEASKRVELTQLLYGVSRDSYEN